MSRENLFGIACKICRRHGRKCDRRLPMCVNCSLRGAECEGYVLRWVNAAVERKVWQTRHRSFLTRRPTHFLLRICAIQTKRRQRRRGSSELCTFSAPEEICVEHRAEDPRTCNTINPPSRAGYGVSRPLRATAARLDRSHDHNDGVR